MKKCIFPLPVTVAVTKLDQLVNFIVNFAFFNSLYMCTPQPQCRGVGILVLCLNYAIKEISCWEGNSTNTAFWLRSLVKTQNATAPSGCFIYIPIYPKTSWSYIQCHSPFHSLIYHILSL